MRYIYYLSAILLLFCACVDGKKSDVVHPLLDTIQTPEGQIDSDSVKIDSVPLAADGIFDDFIYAFMLSKKRQLERTKFPLPVNNHGKKSFIEREDWHYDKLYSRTQVYNLLYQNEQSVGCEKDTSLHLVYVNIIRLNSKQVKQYKFEKERRQWHLTGIDFHNLDININRDFYEFYKKFVSNPRYQAQHIQSTFAFKTYDYENLQEIEGTLNAEQWQDYAPQMPKDEIVSINYNQKYADKNLRVLVLAGLSEGMNSTLFFNKNKKGEWMLTKLYN